MDRADSADNKSLSTPLDNIAAGVKVICGNRVDHVLNGEFVSLQPIGRCDDVILLHQSTEVHNVRHSRNLKKPRSNDPILQCPEVHRCVALVCLNDVPEYLADRPRKRAERGADAVGKNSVIQFFENSLPSKVVVSTVFKCQLDDRESENGFRAAANNVRNRVESPFNGERDLLFDFFGCTSRK